MLPDNTENTPTSDTDLISALDDVVEIHDERLTAIEQRLERLEKFAVINKTAAILEARTMPVSPEMSATGRSENPQAVDVQSALINARSGSRRPNPPAPIQYGSVGVKR